MKDLSFLIPKKEPTKTRGVEQNSHNINKANKSVNLIGSDPSKIKIQLINIKIIYINEGYNKAVNKALFNQFFPLKLVF